MPISNNLFVHADMKDKDMHVCIQIHMLYMWWCSWFDIFLYPVKYYQKGMYQLQMCNLGSVCCLITPGPRGHSMLIFDYFWIFEYSSKHRKSVHALDVNSLFKVQVQTCKGDTARELAVHMFFWSCWSFEMSACHIRTLKPWSWWSVWHGRTIIARRWMHIGGC